MSEAPRGPRLGPGDELDGFVVESVAGRGGMGIVYRARQQRPDRVVALKVIGADLADDSAFRARFQRESTIAAQIEHPNVVPVYAVGEAHGVLYIAMRFVDGTDLRELLANEHRLEPARAAAIVDGAAQALDAAHAHGLVHRDVKPANILLASVAGRDHVYLTDFGLSRHTMSSSGPTRTGAFLGTIDYVAPEQARGERVDARADVYSLGCVLFTALTGTVPFDLDNDLAKLYAHDRRPPPSPHDRVSGLPGAFEAVLARAMAKSPDHRYASAGDLARAALAAAEGVPLPSREHTVALGAAAPPQAREPEPTTAAQEPPPPPPTTAAPEPQSPQPAPEPEPSAATAIAADDSAEPAPARAQPAARQDAPAPRRGRVLAAVGALAAAAVAAALLLSGGGDDPGGGGAGSAGGGGGSAQIASDNLTPNPSFESDTAGWDTFNSDLETVAAADAPDGDNVVRVTLDGDEEEYSLDDDEDSVQSSVEGQTYHAVAWVKATDDTDGKTICLIMRERPHDGDAEAGRAGGGVTATTGEYTPIRVSYEAQGDGNRIDVYVARGGDDLSSGESFLADAITLSESDGDGESSPECDI